MTRVAPSLRPAEGWVALVGIGVVALVLRLAVLPVPGHGGDVIVISRWAENLAAHGPMSFYLHDNAIYPSLLPFLWPLGMALDGEALATAVKGLSIPFDLAIGALLYAVVASRTDPPRGLLAAGLYLFNPAAILAGPVWGQVDAAGTLFFLGALVALAGERHAIAGALTVLAAMAKPQFGLVALPVLVVAVQRWWRGGTARAIGETVLGGAIAAAALGLMLGLSPLTWVDLVAGAAEFQPETSLNAFNIWALLVGFEIPDAPYVGIGALLLAAGVLAALLPLRRGHDLATVLAVGMMLAFAFYFLPTRVHERYLFPALAVAVPFAAVDRASLAAYLALSVGFALALLRALVLTTPFTLHPELASALTSEAMVWLIGLTLVAAALTLIRLTLTGAGDALVEPEPAALARAPASGASAAPG